MSADSNVVLGDIHGCHHFLYIYIYPSFDIMGNILFVCLFVCLKKGNLNILFLSFKYGLVMKCIKLSKTKEIN